MRVLQVVHGFPPECSGGTESYVFRLVRELRTLRHHVEVLTGTHEGRPTDVIETFDHAGITVHRLHRSSLYVDNWDKSYAPEIEHLVDQIVARFKPELVHIHHWIRLTRHLVELFHDRGIPTVCTLHDLWTTCPIAFRVRNWSLCDRPAGAASCHDCAPRAFEADDAENAEGLELFREDLRNEVRLTRRVIVPSAAHRSVIHKHHPDVTGSLRVVPHGSITDLRPASAAPSDGLIHFGHWGNLSFLKGIDILLEAVASLPGELKARAHFHVFGPVVYPDERARVDELVARGPVTMHGLFTPTDLPDTRMDVAIIPTRCSESYSFVLDEAFQMGMPAIVPSRGALGERIGRAGATFEPENARDLARVLAQVIRDPSTVGRWRQAIPNLKSFQSHTRSIVDIYREVLALQSPLPKSPATLRSRRARWRSLQVEARTRRLDFIAGEVRNLTSDVQRASQTMEEMQRFHVEKDKVIAGLNEALGALRGESSTSQADLTARLTESETLVRRLLGDLGDAHLEYNLLVAAASEREEKHAAEAAALAARISTDAEARLAMGRVEAEERAARLRAEARESEARLQAEARAREAEVRNEAAAQLAAARAESAARDQKLAELESEHQRQLAIRDGIIVDIVRALPVPQSSDPSMRPPVDLSSSASPEPSLLSRVKKTLWGGGATQPRVGRLKLLYVLHQFLPRHVAGTELYTYLLAREMRARGHDVVILTCEAHHDMNPYEHLRREFDGIRIHEIVHNYRWDSFEETYDCPRMDAIFERVLDEEKPDLVHVQHLHYFSANFLAIAHARELPIVYTLHDYSLLCARDGTLRRADGELCLEPIPEKCADCIRHFPLDLHHVPSRHAIGATSRIEPRLQEVVRRVNAGIAPVAPPTPAGELAPQLYVSAAASRIEAWRNAAKFVDLFVSPSHFLAKTMVDAGFIPSDRIIVSDNGQDTSRFSDVPARTRGPVVRFGFIGTIGEHKGIHVLIEAMNSLAEDTRAECRIWGDLRAFVEYTDLITRLNRNPRTQFMGHFPNHDVQSILAQIDVLVVPSLWYENAPLTVHEAALARVPVIASDQGGLAEYVLEGQTGLHFYLGSAEDLRNKLVWFLEDPTRCDRFDFSALPVVPIQDDAARTELRYLKLIAALP